ncbi:testis-expressed protein 101 isoform X2 [Choloepus didactylus]|uniref:testis-expressed protein 101 isoform X2 n=1 Tax=Choloepus didactylus TaxID=27675 RepID=UPI00189CB77F|nr:testis-expressed protein 101 isoform X2 [Choloepus didactylus]
MGARHVHSLLFLSLLGAFSVILAQSLYCNKGKAKFIEGDSSDSFNWTSEKVDTCDNGSFCQETALLVEAGDELAVLATKGCSSGDMEMVTLIQHTSPPGLVVVSYSNFCEESLCNDKETVPLFWKSEVISASSVSPTLHCPTCVALGSCFSAPSLPCPNGTTRCYQGKLEITGGGLDSVLEVKGCTAVVGCRLMSGLLNVGPIKVKETCQRLPLTQARNVENGAPWLPISVWRLELLLLLLLQPLVHCS